MWFVGINSTDIIAQWENGSNSDECIEPNSFHTMVTFKCDPYASWERSGVGAGEATPYLVDFFVNFEDPCGVSLCSLHIYHVSALGDL